MKESRMLRRVREEGEVLGHRASILRVLRARFGAPAAAEFTATLDDLDELNRLVPLVDLAATCTNVAEFRAAVQALGTTP